MRDAVCDCFWGYACPLGDLVVGHFLETVHLECLTVFIRELPDGLGGQGHQFSYIKIRILELLLELGVQSLVHLLLNLYVADRIEAFIADNREEE